jgi:UPF0716 protein FxsA
MALLFILLVVVPITEVFLLFQVGGLIGFWPTVGIVIFTAALGSSLARAQALRVWADWSASMSRLESPTHSVLEGIMILVGGVLLITPGFLTDTLGFLLLIPWTRRALLGPANRIVQAHVKKLTIRRLDFGGGAGGMSGVEFHHRTSASRRPSNVVDTTFESIEEEPPQLR